MIARVNGGRLTSTRSLNSRCEISEGFHDAIAPVIGLSDGITMATFPLGEAMAA